MQFDALLDRLAQEVYLGRAHLWIWRHLSNALVEKPRAAKAGNCFFSLTVRAHSHEAFMYLARLFDKTKGAGAVVNGFSGPFRGSMNAMELFGWDDYRRVVELVARGIAAEREEFEKRWRPKHKLTLREQP